MSSSLVEQRRQALAALEGALGRDGAGAFGALLPTRPWREVLDAQFWSSVDAMDDYRDGPRRRVQEALAADVGEEHAATLMEFLLPIPWPVIAQRGFTSRDFRP